MKRVVCRSLAMLAVVVVAGSALAACGDNSSKSSKAQDRTSPSAPPVRAPVVDPGDGGKYAPRLDPADFVDVIDNPYLPMPVGSRWRYEGKSDGMVETVDISVTGDRKKIMGISAFVVRDTVTIGGELVEDTYDWFAQDADGNVWYLGEDVKDYQRGQVVSTAGSWEAGVGGALPGIVMPAAPKVGDPYRQEFAAGEAEDMMEIIGAGDARTVAAGRFDDVVTTRDWSPLEPKTIEEKSYARGVGKIREEKVAGGNGFAELVDFTLGS